MENGNVRRCHYIEADIYQETALVLSSPRGWGESSVVGVRVEREGERLIFTLAGERYWVPDDVLREALKLKR